MIPVATQSLNKSDQIVRQGECPDHNKKSSKFMGEQPMLEHRTKVYWVFRCTEKNGHTFINEPDRRAPKTQEELVEWINKQKLARLQSLDVNRRRKK